MKDLWNKFVKWLLPRGGVGGIKLFFSSNKKGGKK